MSDQYTVFAYDLNTNTKITELPYENLSFGSRLNDAGPISFDIPMSVMGASALVAAILPYNGVPFALYVDRDGVIVWAGIAWTGLYTKSSNTLSIGGKEFSSYFDVRLAAADYSQTTYPSGLDPAALIYQVYTDAQNPVLSGAGASIGLNVIAASTGLTPITPGYPLTQYTMVSQIAQDMAQISQPGVGGIDVSITSAWSPTTGQPVNTLRVWSPRVGNVAGTTGVIFNLTDALDYTWPTDATASGTTVTVTGSGNGANMPVAVANAPGVPVGGLGQSPRLDKKIAVSSQSQPQVSLMAGALAHQYGQPLTTPTCVVPTNGAQPLGSWSVGDDARLFIGANDKDARFPQGLDQFWRIVAETVTVPNEGVATVELTFNLPPVY